MRCLNRAICGKIKRLVVLYLVLAVAVVVVIVVHQQPFLLGYGLRKNARSYKIAAVYPGSFVESYKPANESYCSFAYNLPEELSFEENELEFGPELGARSTYRVLYNVLRPRNDTSHVPVTYATHSTPDFFGYVVELVRSWEGPLSVAVFVPDADAELLTRHLVFLCQCLPTMAKVAVHFVFPKSHPPVLRRDPLEAPPPTSCSIVDFRGAFSTFRSRKGLSYPVNVCRNVARYASTTEYVLVADVELIPSDRLASRFLKAASKLADVVNFPSRVFVVPVFEIETRESVPRTKKELLQMVKQEKAVYFHRHICSHCQKFPGIEQWLDQDPGDVIKIFAATSRVFPYHRWEPVYVGTKSEPFYSEVLSWEGKQDKMTQMLEMCLMGYRFLILDGAFLVHWPGIKRKSAEMRNRNRWRSPYQLRNSRQYNSIVKKLAMKYAKNPRCKMQ